MRGCGTVTIGFLGVLSACGLEPVLPDASGSATEAASDDSAGEETAGDTGVSTEASDSGDTSAIDTGATDPAETGETDTDTDTDTGGPGVDLPDCGPREGSASAAFSVTVDGEPVEIDDSRFFAPHPNFSVGWELWDDLPEIDGPCQVLDFTGDAVSLWCTDATEVERTVDLMWSATPGLAPELAIGAEVELHYAIRYESDMIEHEPDTTAHAFTLSVGGELVLAGIDGRFTLDHHPSSMWPAGLVSWSSRAGCLVDDELCTYVQRVSGVVSTADGREGTTLDGNAVAVGDRIAVLETAVTVTPHAATSKDDCGFFEDLPEHTVRVLVGPPA